MYKTQLCHTSIKENIYHVKWELIITFKIKQEELSFCLSIQKERMEYLHVGKACSFPKQRKALHWETGMDILYTPAPSSPRK